MEKPQTKIIIGLPMSENNALRAVAEKEFMSKNGLVRKILHQYVQKHKTDNHEVEKSEQKCHINTKISITI